MSKKCLSYENILQKNGGKITSLPEEATYIILLKPTFSKATAKLHKEIKDLGRVALSPAFIEASIETDGLVYEPDYLAEDELLPRSLRSLSRKDMKSSQSPHRLSNTRPGTPRKLSSVDTVQSDASFISLSLDRPFEPNFVNGEPYVYSDDDKKYATEAARGFFRKHPDASLATLAQELKVSSTDMMLSLICLSRQLNSSYLTGRSPLCLIVAELSVQSSRRV